MTRRDNVLPQFRGVFFFLKYQIDQKYNRAEGKSKLASRVKKVVDPYRSFPVKTIMELVRLLESHRGRDKIVRLCGYVCMWIGGSGQGRFHERFRIIGGELAACRTVLRLFDDLPMLAANYMYGLGSKEKNPVVRLLSVVTNNIYQLYFPVEHISWLSQKKVLPYNSIPWSIACIGLWALALSAEIIKMIAKILSIKKQLKDVKKQEDLNSGEINDATEQIQVIVEQKKTLTSDLQESYLTLIQSVADIMNAINWLPPGFLWAGKFSPKYSGIFGIIATSMMLIKAWPKKQPTKSA